MRKLFILTLAILFVFGGIALATNIPKNVDPKNFPTVWTEQVYNGSGASITSGHIVEWDHAASEGDEDWYDDMCAWVQTVDSASDIWTAGVAVFGQNIADGDTGAIIIRGPAYVLEDVTTPPTVNQICGSASSGGGVTSDAASGNTTSLGITIAVSPIADGPNTVGMSLIFIDPTQEAD